MKLTTAPTMTGKTNRPRRAHQAVLLPLTFAFALGCDSLLEVSTPGAVDASDLEDPIMARTLVVGALGKFECAVTQYALSTGILANEFWTASGFRVANAWHQRIEAARESNGACPAGRGDVGMGAFFALHQARSQGEEAYRLISEFPDSEVSDKEQSLAMLAAYTGYAYILLGEGFCEMTIDGGPRMSPPAVLAIAEQQLTTAIDHATRAGDEDIRLMALTGRARVRLNLGQSAAAVQDASQIPENFVRYAQHSTVNPLRENRVWGVVNFARAMSVTTAYRDMEVDGVPDPRVSVQNTGGVGQDGVTPAWIQLKYPEPDSWTPIASWTEARLIIAEAEGGQTAVQIINQLRSGWDLPLFESNDPEAILQQVVEERKRQLYAEGHRLNDMLRHNIPFPTGIDHQGANYGPMTCMYLPFSEEDGNTNL